LSHDFLSDPEFRPPTYCIQSAKTFSLMIFSEVWWG